MDENNGRNWKDRDKTEAILVKVYEMGQTPQSKEFVIRRETIGWGMESLNRIAMAQALDELKPVNPLLPDNPRYKEWDDALRSLREFLDSDVEMIRR